MKARTISKVIDDKVNDWLASLPLDVAEYVGSKVVVTGGSIASMFLQEPVNDYDIYFKNIKAAMMVSRHYCKQWIEKNNAQAAKGYIPKPIVPELRLTFKGDSQAEKFICKHNIEVDRQLRAILCVGSEVLDTLIDTHSGLVERVEIFIKSQGFVGDNPEEEYEYFEANPDQSAAESFINNSLKTDTDELDGKNADKYRTVFMSSNAITLSDKVQLVIRFFGEPSEIHDTYDFVHAMNYWTKKTGLVTNTKSLEALLARELVYSGSKYPLASIFRTRKFIQRGWNIHIGNYVKMSMQLNDLNLKDINVLEEQLTGVDAAYLNEIISTVKKKVKDDPDFEFDSAYINTLVDRMMGVSEVDKDIADLI